MKLLIISVIVFFSSVTANGRLYYFRHFKNDNGLSNNTVMDCIQDRRGFVWFGTKEGLTRFDGFQFKIFLHNPAVSNSLKDNLISVLCEDRDGWIWIGTAAGICYYIPDNDSFGTINSGDTKIETLILDIKADNNNCIWIATLSGTYKYHKENNALDFYPSSKYFSPLSINLTNAGDIWMSATDGMIYKYDGRTDGFVSYKILTDKEIAASVRPVNIIDAGNFGLIISTNRSGLKRFDLNTGKITPLFEKNIDWNKVLIRTAYLYNDEEIWVGSESGVYICNLKTGYFKNLQMIRTDPYSISNNAIRSITKDSEGGLWIGTFYGGVNYLPQENKPFEKFYPTGLPGALNGNVVREIRADSYGNIWLGTEDAGLFKLDNKTGMFKNFSDGNGQAKIDSRNIQGVLVDNGDLWIGTFDRGIYILDIATEKITRHFDLSDERNGLNTNSFITFLKTVDGTIYAGSIIGLYKYDRGTKSFNFLDDVAAGTFIHSLYEDDMGGVWIGTYGRGLYKYDRTSGICERVLSDKGDYENLKNERVTCITEDNNQRIWFTTEGNGFSYIDRKTNEIHRYTPGKEVDFAVYSAILQDGHGNMWITSTRGLLKLDPSTNNFITYTKNDGLLDNNFSYNSAYQDKIGKMYFGTTSGLVSFYPAEINENIFNPTVYFTGIQVNGKEYLVNPKGSPGFKSVLVTNRISLKHYQSSLSVDFVSPSYTSPDLIKYKYRMEGSDPDWVTISGNRRVYYTNLSPGDYKLSVLSSSDGKSWSINEATLEIRILPPIWFSVPAYALYFIILALIGFYLIRFYLKRNAMEHQRKIDIIETNKEREILNAKINFFTNITHEVRTPLTLIKGPLDRILSTRALNAKDDEENLLIIKRNTDRLLSLTNQLLDFRKTEKEMFKLNFIRTDFCELLESTFNLFISYSEEKMISYRLHSPVKKCELAVDREAITKILSNLISNAIKYAKSSVDIYLEPETENESLLRLRVNNDGKLVPKELSGKIFEPFFQIDFDKPGEKGTGLGLSLARSLAELHNASLFLDTTERKFNSFVLELTKFQEESITRLAEQEVVKQDEHYEFEIFGSFENSHPIILLVEDEIEMGRFIAKEISGDYNIIRTHNAGEALEALKKYNIILVVSDVVMPGINGYEFCRQIKSNIEFSHIPVILLTATINLNARIEGLDSGADAYLEKPFSTELLMAQIMNLIKNRILERQNFTNSPLVHFKSVAMNKTDEEFLKKLHSSLMDNLSENDLSVERIAALMGVSVSTLYRKVKALTDLNTVEYIRLTRLKKAAELLSDRNCRVNEISYLVGFSSPSYFATSFQKQFGISPSQFIRNLK